MHDMPPGPLFGQPRFRVGPCAAQGLFCLHPGTMVFAGIPAATDQERQVDVDYRLVNYGSSMHGPGETFPDYVRRRRAELASEAELLACYHGITAHVAQVIDLVHGRNTWDPRISAAGLAGGEPCLVTEHIEAEPLSARSDPVPVPESLELTEKLLRLLRVFHVHTVLNPDPRQFIRLTPDDVLVQWNTYDIWLRNLWKLRTSGELKAAPADCDPDLRAFVSPIIAGRLRPAVRVAAAVPPGTTCDDFDLYSVGVILYWMLVGAPDLSGQLPGFLREPEIRRLEGQRQLPSDLAEFLVGLVEHRFHTAQAALDELCRLRRKPTAPKVKPLSLPQSPLPPKFDSRDLLPDGTLVGGRYKVDQYIFVGGMGCVYLGEDVTTRSKVVLKTVRYRQSEYKENFAGNTWREYVEKRRAELFEEARAAIRLNQRTSSVPQLIDVTFIACPHPAPIEPPGASPDPALLGTTEPVLVLEFIPGIQTSRWEDATEDEYLHLIRAVCGILEPVHEPDKQGGYYLYVDWKPENIMYHPESGNVTLVDLGGIKAASGGGVRGEVSSTPWYAGPEEDLPNMLLKPSYDVHGVASVVWWLAAGLAARPDEGAVKQMEKEIEQRKQQKRLPPQPIYDLAKLPPTYVRLRALLERALKTDPAARFQSATEMGAEALAALGRGSDLLPDPVLELRGEPAGIGKVRLTCRLPLDPYCEQIAVCRGQTAVANPAAGVIWTRTLRTSRPGETVTWDDTVDPAWGEVHYAAFSRGYNGKFSAARPCLVLMLVDPESPRAVRLEEAIELRWSVPPSLQHHKGQVVVERLTGAKDKIPVGQTDHWTDSKLDPTQEYEYRLFSELGSRQSPGVPIKERPFPRFARVKQARAEPGDQRAVLHFTLHPGAADRVEFLRTQQSLTQDERDDLVGRTATGRTTAPASAGAIGAVDFELDKDLRIAGLKPEADASLRRDPDGTVHLTWTDRTPRPGQFYVYTPLFTYRDGAQPWLGTEVSVTAFAEAPKFAAEKLPGGVRLRWELPLRAEESVLERLAGDGHAEQTWRLPADQTVLLDRGREPGRAADYRLRVRVGQAWSAGRTATGCAAPAQEWLSRLSVLPDKDSIHLRYRTPPRGEHGCLEVGQDGNADVVQIGGGSGKVWEAHTAAVPAWEPVGARLCVGSRPSGEATAAAFDEVRDVRVLADGSAVDVRWTASPQCAKVLVFLPGTGLARIVPAAAGACRFADVPPGCREAVVRGITRFGDLSRGVAAGISGGDGP